MQMRILITGADGQLGSELRHIIHNYPQFESIFVNRSQLDLSDTDQIQAFFKKHTIDVCINCAAYTAVDKAESEPELATAINVNAVAALAKACAQRATRLIHISSDYVYHIVPTDPNGMPRPLVETDPTTPKGVYAATKLAGEQAVLNAAPHNIVVRTSWVYSTFGNNFVKTMQRLGREKSSLNVVADQVGRPTYARDLAKVLLLMVEKIKHTPTIGGVFNFSNVGEPTNWCAFAQKIHELSGITTCEVKAIATAEYPTPAKRPPYSMMSVEKIQTTFDCTIADWQTALAECMEAQTA
jgi:dTDP-4-dehydrorhamnose reductase